jgi:hypothetical protein
MNTSNESHIDTIIIQNGYLTIMHNSTYNLYYKSYSVRHNDENYVGTYDGIFYKGKIIQDKNLEFCSGAIRSYNDTSYLCYDGLGILIRDTVIRLYSDNIDALFNIDGVDLGTINDIVVDDKLWCVNTSKGIFLIHDDKLVDTLLSSQQQNETYQHNGRFNRNDRFSIQGFIDNKWFFINKANDYALNILLEFDSEINHIDETKQRYISTDNAIYRVLQLNGRFVIDSTLSVEQTQLHGTFNVGNKMYGYSNDGLFRIEQRAGYASLTPLILNEFNKHSLRITNDSIYLGSINGLWAFSKKNMPPSLKVTEKNSSEDTFQITPTYIYLLCGILILFLIFLVTRKKSAKTTLIQTPIDKENIDRYIQENITSVTIVSLRNHFSISQKTLYEICRPATPGELIRNKRIGLVKLELETGKSIREIAKSTGFSQDYLRKVILPNIHKSE